MNDRSETIPIEAVRIRQEVVIDALRDEVWAALTEGIDHWWIHRVAPVEESKMELDPRPGGRFIERWGDDDGALWGTVVFSQDPEVLRIEGSLGAGTAIHGMVEFALEPDGESTRLVTTHVAFGDRGPTAYAPMVEDGWTRLWSPLKAYVEQGVELE